MSIYSILRTLSVSFLVYHGTTNCTGKLSSFRIAQKVQYILQGSGRRFLENFVSAGANIE